MFMRKLFLLNLICATLLLSCKSRTDNGPMVLETREIDFKDKTADEIKAKPLALEVPGIQDLVVHDSLLIFVTSDPQGMLKVYDKNTLQPIASFCTRGRANNEFPGQIFYINMQQYVRDGDFIMPFLDNSTYIQKEVNVSASLREGRTVIGQTLQRTHNDLDFVLLDKGLGRTFTVYRPVWNFNAQPETMSLPVYAITQDNKTVREIEVFKDHVQHESIMTLQSFYHGHLLKHPDRNLVVMPMSCLDYILFFDLDNDRNYAVHQKGTPTTADVYLYDDWNKNYKGGIGGPMHIPGTNMFMCVYSSGKYSEQTLNENGMGVELLVFDYEGNYIRGVKLDRNFLSYSWDPESKILYAAEIVSEVIFTYDLSDFL